MTSDLPLRIYQGLKSVERTSNAVPIGRAEKRPALRCAYSTQANTAAIARLALTTNSLAAS